MIRYDYLGQTITKGPAYVCSREWPYFEKTEIVKVNPKTVKYYSRRNGKLISDTISHNKCVMILPDSDVPVYRGDLCVVISPYTREEFVLARMVCIGNFSDLIVAPIGSIINIYDNESAILNVEHAIPISPSTQALIELNMS